MRFADISRDHTLRLRKLLAFGEYSLDVHAISQDACKVCCHENAF
jgi:hypothetical protein